MSKILITGGAGYIGSYAVKQAISEGYDVVVVDNLSRGSVHAIDKKARFYNCDIRDFENLNRIFESEKIEIVMHFAAKIIVSESLENPLDYFDNNVYGTQILLSAMLKNDVKKIIFSSTAAVYGLLDKGDSLITEDDPTYPINPYGETKLAVEKILYWASKSIDLEYVIFRYFNVAGGEKIGFDKSKHTALIPSVINAANGITKEIIVFGNDYDTKDGTCIRDYIYISDLVDAHFLACKKMLNNDVISGVYNLGNGDGFTVLEVIKTVEKVMNKKIDYTVGDRRKGDPVKSVADSTKFSVAFSWSAQYSLLEDIIKGSM